MDAESGLSSQVEDGLERLKEGYTVLHFNYQGFDKVPAQLFLDPSYKYVTRIHLKRNRLKTLPDAIGNMTNLAELYLHSNNLETLPNSISKLTNLRFLDMSNNNLSSLPESVCHLQSLEVLTVSVNGMTTLPRGIGQMKKLCVFDAMSNLLKHLPVEICHCSSLRRLLVDRNHLMWLPRQLCQMRHLEELSAAGNNLLCLPLNLGDIPSLKTVYVDNNKYLHALPISLQSSEIGFNSCGRLNFKLPLGHHGAVQSISIEHEEDEQAKVKVIYLPPELSSVQTRDNCMLSLQEQASRQVYKLRSVIESCDLPPRLRDILDMPSLYCSACHSPIFSEGFPMVFEGQIRVYSLYYLAVCCSMTCLRHASLLIQLPLVYPDPRQLLMAVALI